jgi:hypothetical protein
MKTNNNTKYKIEKGIPIPPREGRPPKFPFREMNVGESFLLDRPMKNASPLIHSYKKKLFNKDFTARTVGENQTRIWRTK